MQGLWNLIGKVSSGAPNFPYEVGERLPASESKSPWAVHHGKKKATGEPVTVFALDAKESSEHKVKLAKSAIKRLRTLRHPNVVTYIDSLESDTLIYLVTEPVTPLDVYITDENNVKSDLATSWGIHQIAAGLSFLLNDCNLMHKNICMSSVYVDVAGEWKLGGVEYMQPLEPPPGVEAVEISMLPALQVYDPPEGRKYNKMNKKVQKWSADMWGLGCLIWEVFNGTLPRPASLKTVGKIPQSLMSHYGELVSANAKIRPNPTKFIQDCRATGHYLDNKFVEANLFLSELQIKDPKEQKKFFSSLSSSVDSFPEPFCKHRILPQLINAFEFGAAGSAVLSPLFKVGKLLEAAEYEKRIVPCVVKLFSSTDRATRIHLLQQLELFVQHLKPEIVDVQIFPHVALGFGDTVPAMREQTVKAMLLLVPKLSEKTANNQLLKYFAKLQMDQEAGIRTNTTVCLGKIACHLTPATREKVLVSAFLRPLRDPFPPARTAAIMAFCVTSPYYSLKDCASRILPAICSLTVDTEKKVRDQAFKAIKLFLDKLEKASENPESTINTEEEEAAAASNASSWTGWAVSSLTSKLYKGGKGPETAGTATAPAASTDTQAQDRNPEPVAAPQTRPQRKPETSRPTPEPQNEAGNDSGSDYDDGWGGDWDEPQSQDPAGLAEEEARDSGSDYDDWTNDDWSSLTPSKPQEEKASKGGPPPKSASLLFAGPPDTFTGTFDDDPFAALSNVEAKKTAKVPNSGRSTQGVRQKPPSNAPREKEDIFGYQQDAGGWGGEDWDTSEWGSIDSAAKEPPRKGPSGSNKGPGAFGDTAGDWGEDDWGSFEITPSSEPKVKSAPRKGPQTDSAGDWGDSWNVDESFGSNGAGGLSKAELAKKKREERKQQRLQAMKEKKAAGRGPAKLGGVKLQ